ncbi:hypothetical protein [Burkholderia stagnalis]|uniref:hypothetical protein n=1 Tax=Burkholderia stagnalis TaxID=1503054 RepID=UPI000753BF47|nr:hypothetical protein [Burkholderia stagnalis]KVL90760.1 hypothetical protein WT02_23110 [Burkholderia stagnalis]KVL93740.1 hypothetical protein WT03_14945 [Burkholderia stagnalis]KVM02163.1 hypothetical protein WT04_30705 [Burkholderia stagnalis]
MPLLDALINQIGNDPARNPYARAGAAPVQGGGSGWSGLLAMLQSGATPVGGLIDQLGRGPANNPYSSVGAGGGGLSDPQIVQIGADEAARAQAQQGGATVGVGPSPMQQPAPLTAAAVPQVAQSANPPVARAQTAQAGMPQLQSVDVPDFPVKAVDADADSAGVSTPASAPANYSGGLLGMLGAAASNAVDSPAKSKGLLESLGARISNMSPAASQALIASGLTMLAGNDGSRNLGQLVGLGGMAGLNAYSNSTQQEAANELVRQKMLQEARQKKDELALQTRKQDFDESKPFTVGADQSVYMPGRMGANGMPAAGSFLQGPGGANVATWQEMQGADGMKYRQGFTRSGEPVSGARVLVDNPYGGPLSEFQQKSVNDAQTAAMSASQTYQRTASLASQLANAPDFSSGLGATFNDWMTKTTGNKDAGQQLRGQLAQFVNSTILESLPPGSASDKDVQLVRNGTPSDTASKATWQAYLAAVGRLQQASAIASAGRADYLTANRGSLGPLMQPAIINGRQFPAGTSFADAISGRGAAGTQAQRQSTLAGSLTPDQQSQVQQLKRMAAAGDQRAQQSLAQLQARGWRF